MRTGRSEPARISALTFTRKAANEMEQRLRTMLPAGDARAVWISTFHRLCGSLLRTAPPSGCPPISGSSTRQNG